jgi:hypothetical protein
MGAEEAHFDSNPAGFALGHLAGDGRSQQDVARIIDRPAVIITERAGGVQRTRKEQETADTSGTTPLMEGEWSDGVVGKMD